MFPVTNKMIGIDLKFAANKENSGMILVEWFENDANSSGMSLLITGIVIYLGRLGSKFLEENSTWFDLFIVLSEKRRQRIFIN